MEARERPIVLLRGEKKENHNKVVFNLKATKQQPEAAEKAGNVSASSTLTEQMKPLRWSDEGWGALSQKLN